MALDGGACSCAFHLHVERINNSAPNLGILHVSEFLPGDNKVRSLQSFKSYEDKEKLNVEIHTSEITRQGEITCKLSYPDIHASGVNLFIGTIFSKDKRNLHILGIIFSAILAFLLGLLITGIAPNSLMGRLQNKTEALATIQQTTMPTSDNLTLKDLPNCDFDTQNFPCKYWTNENEFPKDIANDAYNNRTEFVGRIIELYRDVDSGKIPVFKNNQQIIIPDPNREINTEYYEFYFQLLSSPIFQCTDINPPPTPCWYISEGEKYEELVSYYSTPIDETCIKSANKTEWDGSKLVPKTIKPGVMIMLPVCP